MPITILAENPATGWRVVYWSARALPKGCPLCECEKLTDADAVKLMRVIDQFVRDGAFRGNTQKFKKLEGQGGLCEIKGWQHRLLGGYDDEGKTFVVVRCVKKKQDRHEPSHLRSARESLRKYNEEKKQ